jgi:hypothetical protein
LEIIPATLTEKVASFLRFVSFQQSLPEISNNVPRDWDVILTSVLILLEHLGLSEV